MADDVELAWADTGSTDESTNLPYVRNLTPEPELLQIAAQKGGNSFTVIFSGVNGSLPKSDPRAIRTELIRQVGSIERICKVHQTRNGSLVISTPDAACAAAVYSISDLLGIAVRPRIVWENITNRFLLRDIPSAAPLAELARELIRDNDIQILELRRFINSARPSLFSPVLVTVLGTSLPQEIKVWLTVQQICQFNDRPRQCSKCFQFSHAAAKCNSAQLCSTCGTPHDGHCSSQLKCLHCSGNHCADDKSCPAWAREEEILHFKCRNFLSFADARRKFASLNSNSGTYARVAQPPVDSGLGQVLLQSIQDLFNGHINVIVGAFKEILAEQTELLKEWLCMFHTQPGFSSTFSGATHSEEETGSGSTVSSQPSASKKRGKRKKKHRKNLGKDTRENIGNTTELESSTTATEVQRSSTPLSPIGNENLQCDTVNKIPETLHAIPNNSRLQGSLAHSRADSSQASASPVPFQSVANTSPLRATSISSTLRSTPNSSPLRSTSYTSPFRATGNTGSLPPCPVVDISKFLRGNPHQ